MCGRLVSQKDVTAGSYRFLFGIFLGRTPATVLVMNSTPAAS